MRVLCGINWVQTKGEQAQADLEAQLIAQAEGQAVVPESRSAMLAALPLAIAADGVMVPFRPVASYWGRISPEFSGREPPQTV